MEKLLKSVSEWWKRANYNHNLGKKILAVVIAIGIVIAISLAVLVVYIWPWLLFIAIGAFVLAMLSIFVYCEFLDG